MKPAAILLLLLLTASLSGQQPTALTSPSIKGHHLGEPISEFVAGIPGGGDQVRDCEEATASGKKKAFKHLHVEASQCALLLAGVHNGAHIELNHAPLHATFSRGVMVKLVFDVGEPLGPDAAGVLYELALSDAVEKFGTPTREDVRVFQNGFGATFPHRVAWWETAQYTVMLYEGENTVYRHWSTLTLTAKSEDRVRERGSSLN